MSSKQLNITPENMKSTALQIIDFLSKNNLWKNVCIYVANEAWYSDPHPNSDEHKTNKNVTYFVKTDMDVIEYLGEYCNPETISMTFEGPLYHKINYNDYDFVQTLTKKFLDKYDLYFELGHAWSMTAYH